ncbi:hypothetical protein A1O1_02215 [Capronia coronata CBS 617.96]|uniref:Apple domain-containing protein n=1 Tax=Capronia coronata CBS 617.96 TaxID=1182541 RepID=W9YLQ1_9EURO|nr:uncharacterized protein A1O1_02215 [Capronia coronata CBS 617.96]EXJ93822.1 hypothetical protein A1O1_02215 [Capronia coronata CBS 617.96]
MSQVNTNLPTSSPNELPSAMSSSGLSDKYPVISRQENQPGLVPVAQQQYQQPTLGFLQNEYPSQYQQGGQYPTGYGLVEPQEPAPAPRKPNPWGLSPLAFGILVAAVTAVVVGGAVGGGVAGAMSSKRSDSSSAPVSVVTVTADSSSATTTSTGSSPSATSTTTLPLPSSLQNFVVPEPYYVDTLENPGCSGDNSKIVIQEMNVAFDLFCGVDMQNSIPDLTDSSLVVADVVGLFAYSITDCLYACANARHFVSLWGQDHEGGNMQTCKGVTWNFEMAASNTSDQANCWLKNGTSNGFQSNTCISATLAD